MSPTPLTTKKRVRKASCAGTACKYVAESHEPLWNIPLLTAGWLIVFRASFLKLFSSHAVPYLWCTLDTQGAHSDMRNDSAVGSKLLKSCCPSADELRWWAKAMWTKEISVKTGWTLHFICLYIPSSFKKLTSVFQTQLNFSYWHHEMFSISLFSPSLGKYLARMNPELSFSLL